MSTQVQTGEIQRMISSFLFSFLLLLSPALAQTKEAKPVTAKTQTKPVRTPKTIKTKPADELARLREEFIKATNEYKASLEKLRAKLREECR